MIKTFNFPWEDDDIDIKGEIDTEKGMRNQKTANS
jgi:hypothetical protein